MKEETIIKGKRSGDQKLREWMKGRNRGSVGGQVKKKKEER